MAKKKIVEAQIFGDVLYDHPLHRKWVKAASKILWTWNKKLKFVSLAAPIAILIFQIIAWKAGVFSSQTPPDTEAGYSFFKVGFVIFATAVVQTTFVSYSYIFSYLDFFGQINRTPQKSIRGLDVVERIRKKEVHQTGVAVLLAGLVLALFMIGTIPQWIPKYLSPSKDKLIREYIVAAVATGVLTCGVMGFLGIKFGWKAAWGYRFLLVIFLILFVMATSRLWGDWAFSEAEVSRMVYSTLFMTSIGVNLSLIGFILYQWSIFLKPKEIREAYRPDTVPLITPRNIFEFIRTFADPLSELHLQRRLLVLYAATQVEEETAFSKLLLMLHFYRKRLKVEFTGVEGKTTDVLELDRFLSELAEVFPFPACLKPEMQEEFKRQMELQGFPPFEEAGINGFEGRWGLQSIYWKFCEMNLTTCEMAVFLGYLSSIKNQSDWEAYLAWTFGLEDEDMKERRLKIWKEFVDEEVLKKYPSEAEDLRVAPHGTTFESYERAYGFVSEFFKLVERLFLEVSSGKVFNLASEDEAERDRPVTAENTLFDVEVTRELFSADCVNVMGLIFNKTNFEKLASVRCMAPGFDPDEIEITLNVKAKSEPLRDFIAFSREDVLPGEDENEHIRNLFRVLPFSKVSEEDLVAVDDLIKAVSEILKTTRVIWFRLYPQFVGEKTINLLLVNEHGQVIDGKTITIRSKRNVRQWVQRVGGIAGAALGGLLTAASVVQGLLGFF
ncbi:MAG: hypothetical protein Kow0069_31220 [Promethearchaeota archaeon]